MEWYDARLKYNESTKGDKCIHILIRLRICGNISSYIFQMYHGTSQFLPSLVKNYGNRTCTLPMNNNTGNTMFLWQTNFIEFMQTEKSYTAQGTYEYMISISNFPENFESFLYYLQSINKIHLSHGFATISIRQANMPY